MIEKEIYYNTQREPLRLPEYGRHVQEMVNYIKTIPDREERNRLAHVVIQIMANFNPSLKDNPEHKAKLWNQLAQIANYELDIDYPVPIYKTEDFKLKRKKINYPEKNNPYKHYGNLSVKLAQAILSLPESEERQQLLIELANHMKKQYLIYNKESVSDEQIFNDIKIISNASDLNINNIKLNETRDILYKNRKLNKKNNKRR